MKLAAYLRVSTDRQAEHGLGLDVQRQAIREWSKANGHRVTVWASDEGVSGSNGLESRIGLADALAAVRSRQAGGIVVYRLDRLARDMVLQEQLLSEVWRMGGRVFSTSAAEDSYLDPDGADADPSRALIRQILGAVAQYERAMIRLRLRAGRRRKAEQGGYAAPPPPPLGYRVERGELVPDDDEQRVLARIKELRATPDPETGQPMSLRRIAETLTAEDLRPKRSKSGRWHPESLRLILKRLDEEQRGP
jgi:DNA invertase Pin-like site-specific DNA recombinase